MWSFDFTMPTVVAFGLLIYLFLSKKRLPIQLSRLFFALMGIDLLTMGFDYLSTYMDQNFASYSQGELYMANGLFFLCFLLRAFYFATLSVDLFDARGRRARKYVSFLGTMLAAFMVLLLLNTWTGWIFSIGAEGYVSGPHYQLINVFLLLNVLVAFVYLAGIPDETRTNKVGAYLYNSFLLLGIVVRYVMPRLIVMNLFCLFALMVIFFHYLNPDAHMDHSTGLFNLDGLAAVADARSRGDSYHMVGFAIRGYGELDDLHGVTNVRKVLGKIGHFVSEKFPWLYCFYLHNGWFVLLSYREFDRDLVIRTLRDRFSRGWEVDGNTIFLSVDYIEVTDQDFLSSDHFMGCLRTMLEEASTPGRPEVQVLDKVVLDQYSRYVEVEQALQYALANDGVHMYLQPITRNDGRLVGAEALARIEDKEGKLIGPGEFIPLALRDGSISDLGFAMFSSACALLSDTSIDTSRLDFINVNVAPMQFLNPNMASTFLGILDSFGLDAQKIRLEVTEEDQVQLATLKDQMAVLQERGVLFVLDDFGTAYANVSRLKHYSFVSVKIDKSIVWEHFEQPDTVMAHIIAICHDLGVTVTAEGVETQEMADGLREMGCDYFQGYLYDKPLPAKTFVRRYLM